MDGDACLVGCFRAFNGTGGGGIIFADDCESDTGDFDFVSTPCGQGHSFMDTSSSMTEESTSIQSSMGILTTSLDAGFRLGCCGDGSTDSGSGSEGLTVCFPDPPGTLRVGLPEAFGIRRPAATSWGLVGILALNLDLRTSFSRRLFFKRVFSSRASETPLSISKSFGWLGFPGFPEPDGVGSRDRPLRDAGSARRARSRREDGRGRFSAECDCSGSDNESSGKSDESEDEVRETGNVSFLEYSGNREESPPCMEE